MACFFGCDTEYSMRHENMQNVVDSETRNATVNVDTTAVSSSDTAVSAVCVCSATPWRLQYRQLLLHTKPRFPAGLDCTQNTTDNLAVM